MRTDNSVVAFGSFGGAFAENGDNFYCISSAFGLLKFDYDANSLSRLNLKITGMKY